MKIPRSVANLIQVFENLPGVGPKTAARLTYYLLQSPSSFAEKFAESLQALHRETRVCSLCQNISERERCEICEDASRDRSLICVVEKPLDILSLEKSGHYHGLYQVLGGAISPLNNIGPDELYVREFLSRLSGAEKLTSGSVAEIILATNTSLEGEATAMYLRKLIKEVLPLTKVTRIGRGLPVGADLEYADSVTLKQALMARSDY